MSVMAGPEQFEQVAAPPDLYARLADETLAYGGGPPVSLRTLGAFCPLDLEALPIEDKNKWIVDAYNQFEGTVPLELADYFTDVSTELNQEPQFKVAEPDPSSPQKSDMAIDTLLKRETVPLGKGIESLPEPVNIEQHVVQNQRINEILELTGSETQTLTMYAPEAMTLQPSVNAAEVSDPLIVAINNTPSEPVALSKEMFLQAEPVAVFQRNLDAEISPDQTVIPFDQAENIQIQNTSQTEVARGQAEIVPLYIELPAPLLPTELPESYAMVESPLVESSPAWSLEPQINNAIKQHDTPVAENLFVSSDEHWVDVLHQEPEAALTAVGAVLTEYAARHEDALSVPVIVEAVSQRIAELQEEERAEIAPLMQNIVGAVHGLELLIKRGETEEQIAAVRAELEGLCAALFEALHIPYDSLDVTAFIEVLQSQEFKTILIEKRGTHEVKLFFQDVIKDSALAVDQSMHSLLGMVAVRLFAKPLMVN